MRGVATVPGVSNGMGVRAGSATFHTAHSRSCVGKLSCPEFPTTPAVSASACNSPPWNRAESQQGASTSAAVNSDYLKQKLHYSEDGTKLLDADGAWVLCDESAGQKCLQDHEACVLSMSRCRPSMP